MGECYYKNHSGSQCLHQNKSNDPECNAKVKMCQTDNKFIHQICDPVWNIDCKYMNKDVYDRIKWCNHVRQSHTINCVHPNCRDTGHKGASEKMESHIARCLSDLEQNKKMFLDLIKKLNMTIDIGEHDILGFIVTVFNPINGKEYIGIGHNLNIAFDDLRNAMN